MVRDRLIRMCLCPRLVLLLYNDIDERVIVSICGCIIYTAKVWYRIFQAFIEQLNIS